MSELVTAAKVRFIQDKYITNIPIDDIIEFREKKPAHKKDFSEKKLYKGFWKDSKNPDGTILPIQVGGLACGKKEEELLEKKRITFPPVTLSDLDRFSDSTDGHQSHTVEDIEKHKKKLKNKNIKKAVNKSNKKQLSLYEKDVPHFNMRDEIEDKISSSEDEDYTYIKASKRPRFQILSDSDSDDNLQSSKMPPVQLDDANTTVATSAKNAKNLVSNHSGSESEDLFSENLNRNWTNVSSPCHVSNSVNKDSITGTTIERNPSQRIARKLVYDYSDSKSDDLSPDDKNKHLSCISTPSHVSNSVDEDIMRLIDHNNMQGEQSSLEDNEFNNSIANQGSNNNDNPLNIVDQETLQSRQNDPQALQQFVENGERMEVLNPIPNLPKPKRGYVWYRLKPPTPIDPNDLTKMNMIQTPAGADEVNGEGKTKYEKIDDKRIYLGAGKAVEEDYWEHHKKKAPWEFVRETSQLLWSKRGLINRCIQKSQTKIRLVNRSPRKPLTPSKYEVLKDLFSDYLDEKEEYVGKKRFFFSKMNRHIGYKIKDLRDQMCELVSDEETDEL